MERYIITIDAGTTNTRAFLWDDRRRMIAEAGAAVGVHDTAIDGNNDRIKGAVRDCLNKLLDQAHIGFDRIEKIMACGMITSGLGLVEIPHVMAPAGKRDLARHCRSVLLEDVCPLPILFIPGVRNAVAEVDLDSFEAMDIMRGEETESVAILEHLPAGQPYLLVLPGSHTKFVSVDAQGRIQGGVTSMSGELLDGITNHTIIADAVAHGFVSAETYDPQAARRGFETARRVGLARSAFSARILSLFAGQAPQSVANYLLGAVLAEDVQAICRSSALRISPDAVVVVSGKAPLRRAIADVLKWDGFFRRIDEYIPDPKLPLSAVGTYIVADAMKD